MHYTSITELTFCPESQKPLRKFSQMSAFLFNLTWRKGQFSLLQHPFKKK